MSPQNNNLAKIEHIVVLMMENRSFDNVLGWLYGPKIRRRVIRPSTASTPPCATPGRTAVRLASHRGNGHDGSFPHPELNFTITGTADVQRLHDALETNRPPEPIPNTTASPAMQGFVIDYNNAIQKANVTRRTRQIAFCCSILASSTSRVRAGVIAGHQRAGTGGMPSAIPGCSVPTQTFPNRSLSTQRPPAEMFTTPGRPVLPCTSASSSTTRRPFSTCWKKLLEKSVGRFITADTGCCAMPCTTR